MRFTIGISTFLALVGFVSSQDRSVGKVKATFDSAHIPEDLHITFNPRVVLEVTFPQTSSAPITLTAGVQLKRNQTAGPPTFAIDVRRSLPPLPTAKTFVVAAVDPDAPTPQSPTSAQIRHFLGGNFELEAPDRHGFAALKNTTAALSMFQQPTPPAGSDPHRYVFLLFEQPRGFNQQTLVNSSTSIANFNISQFALEVGLGSPIAGTFMRVGPDPATA